MDARLGPALETLDALLAEAEAAGQGGAPRFDLCFIDADKRAYGDYYDRAMKLVSAEKGTRCVRCKRACMRA